MKEDPKSFWKYVRDNTKTTVGIGKLTRPDGTATSNDSESAIALNDHFLSVFTIEDMINIPQFIDRTDVHIQTIPIDETKVEAAINSINPSKAQGSDNIHPRVIRQCSANLIKPLTKIFKTSISEGKLPNEWKNANVTAIFKKGQRTKPENYRPISVTSICCRLMEKLIRDAIVDHLERNNLITNVQHGFRKKHSCVTQLLECIEEWTESIDQGHDIDIIYLDFRAAFDKVPHRRLLAKLWGYGIRGKLHEWIAHFLTNRKQRVLVNGEESEWGDVISGVPQGSVLGPVLFLIFINDLPEIMRSTVKLFADDTKLYTALRDPNDAIALQDDIFTACDWADCWNLEFNAAKCKSLHIGKDEGDEYFIKTKTNDIVKVSQVNEEKDLGVLFDRELKFSKHIAEKVKKANRNLGLICKTFSYMTKPMFLNLYKSLVRPHVEYATVICSPRLKKDKIAIENVQRRATKVLSNISHLPYHERLKSLGLPSLEYRRERADMIQVFRIKSGLDHLDQNCFFPPPPGRTNYGGTKGRVYNSRRIYKRHSRTDLRKATFSQRVVNGWNKLPENVVTAPSLNAFKSRLNKHWVGGSKFNPVCYN